MHKCGLLLQMSFVAWSVCLCVRTEHTGEKCKTGESIEIPFRRLTGLGPRNYILDGNPDFLWGRVLLGVVRPIEKY